MTARPLLAVTLLSFLALGCGGGKDGAAGNSPPPACTPTTCSQAGRTCGPLADGCGTTLDCGACGPGQVCSGSGTCAACVPTVTCVGAGRACGPLDDGCGTMLDCGGCGLGQACSPAGACAPAPLAEEEPASGTRSNDTLDTAQPVAVGDVIDGAVGAAVADVADLDLYRFTGSAGQVLRVTVQAAPGSLLQPLFQVRNRSGSYVRMGSASTDPSRARRQLYLPESGDYYVLVLEARNVASEPPPNLGGAEYGYRLVVESSSLAAASAALPLAETGAVDDEGNLAAFQLTLVAGEALRAETRAARLATPSQVDTVLLVVDATQATPAVLAQNDDIDMGLTDSSLEVLALHGGPHLLILDHFALPAGATARGWELSAALVSTAAEREPNGASSLANVLPVPGTVEGTIFTPGTSDLDWFRIQAQAGDAFVATVTKPAGSGAAFHPWLAFAGPSGAVTFVNRNRAGEGVVRLEGYAFEAGPHYVLVGDIQGDMLTEGQADYSYVLEVTASTRTVAALGTFPIPSSASTAGAIDLGGRTAWYGFSVPAGPPVLAWIDLDLTAPGADGFSLDPYLALYGGDGRTVLAGGPVLQIRDLLLDPGSYTLAVSDFGGGHSASHHAFRPRVVAASSLTPVADDGSHTTQGSALALALGSGPVLLQPTLQAGGAAWYALGTLPPGTRLSAITSAGAGGAEVDTLLELRDAGGGLLASADDTGGSLFSTLHATVGSTGGLFLRVAGANASVAGSFRLRVRLDDCAGSPLASAGQLHVNELLVQPEGAPGDANGDGTTDGGDEFVELRNLLRNPLDLSQVVLRDGHGVRYRFACGESLAAGMARTVFGGCGGAACASLALANAQPDAPDTLPGLAGLGLDDAGGQLLLVSAEGAILERVDYATATPNVSFASGSGGSCDQAPAAAGLQLSTSCAGSVCGAAPCFTPGTTAAGAAFQAPPRPAGDTCAMAVAVTAPASLSASTAGYSADVDVASGISAACSASNPYGGAGPDRIYSVTVPAGSTLFATLTPNGWDASLTLSRDCTSVGPTCVASIDDGGLGQAEQAHWVNTTGGAATLYVVVDSWAAAGVESSGPFALDLTLSP